MPNPHEPAAIPQRVQRPEAIEQVAGHERRESGPRVVTRLDVGREQNATAGPTEPRVEVHVRAAYQALIVESDPIEDVPSIAAERRRVGPARSVGADPKSGVAR